MASSPDLFVVCKNCGSEVSPYITECPYCGTRLRKRAPKIERDGTVSEPKPKKAKKPKRPPRERPERPGVAARLNARPYATLALVILSLFGYLVLAVVGRADIAVAGPVDGEWWRVVTSPFVYGNVWYELAAVTAIGVFGWLLERRHGPWAPLLVFVIGGAAGNFLAIAGDDVGIFIAGANGAALAMLAAWAMRDVLGRRRNLEDNSDLLGALAIAAVLILLPLASVEASALAGLGGGIAGVILGVILAKLPER
jgi:membrane associated rhomboid family serine protease